MNRKNLWKLLSGLGLAFAFPWLLLIVLPYINQANAGSVAYAEGEDIDGGYTEYPSSDFAREGSVDRGEKIYRREGCAYCHTQMVRPTYAGPDMWHEGWGGSGSGNPARETRPQDYVGERFAHLGYQRIGQDLANVGSRLDADALHRILSDPESVSTNTVMPAFRHLYKNVSGEWQATGDANALVAYLLSRRKNQPLPLSLK